mgnify:CR=1 FL=1
MGLQPVNHWRRLAVAVALLSAVLAVLISPWFLVLAGIVGVSQWAFVAFGDPHERTAALRLFESLRSGYPSSTRIKDADGQQALVLRATARNPVSFDASRPVPKPMPTPVKVATIKDLRRTVMGDIVRIGAERRDRISLPSVRSTRKCRSLMR